MIDYKKEKDLFIPDDPTWPRFKELVAGVGWMDASGDDLALSNWAIVIGHTESDEFVAVEEITGTVGHLAEELTDAKDRYLLQRIFVDRSQPANIRTIVEHDGLTRYQSLGKSRLGNEQWVRDAGSWENFRSRSTVCSVVPLLEELSADVQGATELVHSLLSSRVLKIRSECPGLLKAIRLHVGMLVGHPVIRALSYPLIILDRERKRGAGNWESKTRRIYPNLGR